MGEAAAEVEKENASLPSLWFVAEVHHVQFAKLPCSEYLVSFFVPRFLFSVSVYDFVIQLFLLEYTPAVNTFASGVPLGLGS